MMQERDPHNKAKDEDEEVEFPFQNLEKTQVLQETRIFNESPLSPRKCVLTLLQLLYVIYQGKNLNATEATDVFMNITKLFLSPDVRLRRMLYIAVKELSRTANQTFVASNSLFKDMSQNQNEDFKINAIRSLRTIMDENLFSNLERHLKQCVVDKNPGVASSAILAGFHMSDSQKGDQLVKRWTGEIQSAVDSRFHMVQYHALALSYKLRHQDGLAISKIVSAGMQNLRSPLAHTLLIKYSMRIMRMEGNINSDRSKAILQYLTSCLKFRNDMVILEAAKAICTIRDLGKELSAAIEALRMFLSSNKPVKRFAAIRLLNDVANHYPTLVSQCNNELEKLIADPNRNIATLAVTTLLKTGQETNIEKLMKKIQRFIPEIPDEFKIIVVKSIESLCIRYPKKFYSMVSFLSNALRTEGGYEYKKQLVSTLISICKALPESRDLIVSYLCEFIEDCEYTIVLQQVLHFLGDEGTQSTGPSKCIRFIYNRLILENPTVRGSAVITIAKFAAKIPDLRKSILVILRRVLLDSDDEVRDRAVFYVKALETKDEDLIRKLIVNDLPDNMQHYFYSVEKSLVNYLQSTLDEPFDLSDVQLVDASAIQTEAPTETGLESAVTQPILSETTTTETSNANDTQEYEQAITKIPQLQNLGKVFKTNPPIYLTEVDADYVVSCAIHVFESNIVLQYIVKNRVESQQLSNLIVDLDLGDFEDVQEVFKIQAESAIKFNQAESTFVVLKREKEIATGKIFSTLKFCTADVDPETGDPYDEEDENEDEFELEAFNIRVTDFVRNMAVSSFKEEWDKLGEESEFAQQPIEYTASDDLQAAVDKFISSVGLRPIGDRTVSKKTHSLYFAGKSIFGDMVLVAAQLGEKNGSILLKLSVRSQGDLRESIVQQLSD
ncbi:coatomer protein gamma 2-subunit [Naegleria gruberi]|uniref:Coatomer subunit gamma n=1 Tax=Naegleria gruberi TaxID=5762 RepID=D2W169_NAEGR|nr:coatomer protein gamma 2-subunit [Naegleria gruberi]EFC37130.1 coatomer protein gamma 2-subunit [Naegleria gruberi]|eukprot:XP_002669874.1 coatomer protein gamma 2-subunit [Naegleria gruberi strain NEG-M]